MAGEPLNVLFLCPNNACRSIIAEALLNRVGRGHFRAFSAGQKPSGQINPYVRETLKHVGYDLSGQIPKSWDVFVSHSAPRLDAVITLAESMKAAKLPIWYSNPVLVHWDFANPELVEGEDSVRIGAFRRCYGDMEQQMLKVAGIYADGLRGEALAVKLRAIAPQTHQTR
ncbi:arsenate reductase ArsC [Magnetovibrio sp.]|uniref:arsenate reductase ArsC n=1 Tax=Magnetovibrio sp. TaxID=2024836 RepID=UPI002F92E1A0